MGIPGLEPDALSRHGSSASGACKCGAAIAFGIERTAVGIESRWEETERLGFEDGILDHEIGGGDRKNLRDP